MSPEVRNASPRPTSAAISASEEWRLAGGCAMADEATGGGLSATVELSGGGGVVADADLVSVFGAACGGSKFVTLSSGGRSIDPSSLTVLVSPILSGAARICSTVGFRIEKSPILATNTTPEAASPIR